MFHQLTSVLSKIDPAKLNETLGAIATAFNGSGRADSGRRCSDLNAFLAKIDPSLPSLKPRIDSRTDGIAHLRRLRRQISSPSSAIRRKLSQTFVERTTEPRHAVDQHNRVWPTSAPRWSAGTGRR